MNHAFDRRSAYPADSFWFFRPLSIAQQAEPQPAPEPVHDVARDVFARDWIETSVRFGAVRWSAE